MHPLQGIAEPLHQDSGTSGKSYLRMGQMLHNSVRTEEKIVRNSAADIKMKAGEGEGAQGTKAEIPLQPVEKTMVKQVFPLQSMEVPV